RAQLTGGPKRSRSQRSLDQGGIRDASGPNRLPYCPKYRRRDGGGGEAVTRPVVLIRGTTRTVPSDSIVLAASAPTKDRSEKLRRDDYSGRLDIAGPITEGPILNNV